MSHAQLTTLRVLGSSPRRDTPWGRKRTNQPHVEDRFEDVNAHEGNLALFHFCGPGIRIGDVHALLAQDFGLNPRRQFDHALEPPDFAAAMRKAQRQILLIDACSTTVRLPEEYERVEPQTFIQAARNNNLCSKQAYIRASKFGTRAYGAVNAPSLFMDALF
jgi:hypothetical protein